MKIALVCDWYLPRIGGIERHLAGLGAKLAASGHAVTVITPTKGTNFCTRGVQVLRLPGNLIPGIGLIWTPNSFRQLGAAIRGGQFDVVHVHSSIVSPAAYGATYLAQRAALPTVCTSHSVWGGFRGTFRTIDRLVHWSQWPVAFSSVSERVACELRPLTAPHPVDVLPNAIDPAEWHLILHPPCDVINIGCVMRLVHRKRGAVLLHALASVCSQLPSTFRIRLHIAGDGPDRRHLQRLAQRLGLSGCVTFLGSLSVPEVKALLAISHFFVLPSKLEAFGIAALEARAAGLPVIAMSEAGVREFIVDGKEGLLARDDRQLASHLFRLCTDSVFRNTIVRHNQHTPVAFTWERSLAAHLATYQRARRLSASTRVPAAFDGGEVIQTSRAQETSSAKE